LPEDFLIRFDFPNHRRIAMEAGSLPCRGATLSLKPWSPTARGVQRSWRFYCRLAIEGLPQQSWSIDSTQQVVAGKVIVDRLEQQSVDKTNTSACFAWAGHGTRRPFPPPTPFPSVIGSRTAGRARRGWTACRRCQSGRALPTPS
jgi:hypothetical protein